MVKRRNPLPVLLVDESDDVVVDDTNNAVRVYVVANDVASGGTSAADDADFVAGTTSGTPFMGVYESTPTNVTDGDMGVVGIATGRRLKTSATVDAALPAGTNAIGKLLPPDVDVTAHANYARKYYTSAGAATDGIVWSPAAGKRWHVVALHVQVSAACTVTLEDDKAAGDDPVWKGEFAANSGAFEVFPEKYPLASGEDAADLLVTTTAGNIYITAVGYEV